MKLYQEKAENICRHIQNLDLPPSDPEVIEYVRKQLVEIAKAVAEETRENRGDY